MNTWNRICCLLIFGSLLSCAQQPADTMEGIAHVIVIGVDGMSPDGIRQANTPNIDRLVAGGAATFRARGVLPTSSSPNWASMITGAGPEQHGITSNAWENGDFVLPAAASGPNGYFPSIFTLIRDQMPEAEMGAIFHWEGFGRLFDSTLVNLYLSPKTEEETTEIAATYLIEKQPDFCFIHLDHVDGAGHSKGHGSPAYYAAVSKSDSLIGILLEAMETAGILDNSLLILSSDHGGIGFGHGGETLEEIEIPFILSGKSVKKTYSIQGAVNTYDNAVTAAFAMGLEMPNAWIGRPVKEAFIGFDTPEISYPVKPLIRKPLIHPERIGFEQAGGLFLDSLPLLRIDNPNAFGEIRYTLNGEAPSLEDAVFEAPFLLEKTTVVKAALFEDNQKVSEEATGYFRIHQPGSNSGVNYETYLVPGIDQLPDFKGLSPVSEGRTHEITLDNVAFPQEEQVAAIFTTQIQVEKEGEYQFYLVSDDGSKLLVNNELIVDNDGDHGMIERSGKLILPVGKHQIQVQYFNAGGGKGLLVFFKGPGISKRLLPADLLFVP